VRIIAIMRPYRPKASAKIRIKIIPTKIASYCALALTPASPTTPIAKPAAYNEKLIRKLNRIVTSEERPQQRPEAKC
jgi:hypothetical protein